MSNPLVDAIHTAAERAVIANAAGWRLATVTAANSDGTVDITTALGPVAGVRRLKAYSAPAVGDNVMVTFNSDGNWLVVGALAS